MKANKGEWSEFYAFLKILEDKKLPAANKDLEIISDKFFIFKKIIRNESHKDTKIYELQDNKIIILDSTGMILKSISNDFISGKSKKLFEDIKNSHATFSPLGIERLMDELLCTQIKSDNSKKSDLDGIIFDRISEKDELLGFSIKSMLGSASTLLNAGKTTNFIYKIKHLSKEQINEINEIGGKSKIRDRLKMILSLGGELEFEQVSKDTFETNLRKIDTIFSQLIAQMLLDFFLGKGSKISDLTKFLCKNEFLTKTYRLSISDYEFKLKNFLISIALGMNPGKVWDGFTKAHGGYIIIKNDGVVICYHLYNREEFLSYLYENTKLESPSSGRHDYGKVYEQDGELFFNLNLQIRFLK